MATKHDLLTILARHIGRKNGIKCKALAAQLQISERDVRHLVEELRDVEDVALCGLPSTGYFVAATPEELEDTCKFLRSRTMTTLKREARLRKVSLPQLLGQLLLPT